MKVTYSKKEDGVNQKISTEINANVSTVFQYLSTTEGIQQWFPQLVIEERKTQGTIRFVMDEATKDKKMKITNFEENRKISYTWDIGNVSFELQQLNNRTKLIFNEYLPFDFSHIVLDFTGWQFQLESVKNLVESGSTLDHQQIDFETRQQQIASALDLKK